MRLEALSTARLVRRLLWSVGFAMICGANGAQQGAWAESAGEGASAVAALRSAARPSRPRVWENGVGSGFRKATLQWGLGPGLGLGNKSLGSRDSHDLALAMAHFGWSFAGAGIGDQWYRGSPELLAEVWGGKQTAPRHRWLYGLTPVIRYNFAPGGRWVPFVDGGAGIAQTSIRGRDLSTGFEFNVQAGAGAHYFLRDDTALTLQYRWFHLSNGGIQDPNNGTNTQMFFASGSRFY